MTYVVVGWVHRDNEDDYPFQVALDVAGAIPESYEEAREIAVEMLKQLGSKDLTDFEVFSCAPS